MLLEPTSQNGSWKRPFKLRLTLAPRNPRAFCCSPTLPVACMAGARAEMLPCCHPPARAAAAWVGQSAPRPTVYAHSNRRCAMLRAWFDMRQNPYTVVTEWEQLPGASVYQVRCVLGILGAAPRTVTSKSRVVGVGFYGGSCRRVGRDACHGAAYWEAPPIVYQLPNR